MRLRRLPVLLLASLLAACHGEEASRSGSADLPSPAVPRQEGDAAAATPPGAVLKTDGQISFQGASSFFCVPHEESGLQVDFRTGDAGMPTVAVRIEDYRGGGPYQARLFVTGRSATGALVASEGEANVEVQQQGGAAGTLVSGKFQGRYAGEAGTGTIEGRFGSCSYSTALGGAPPLAAETMDSTPGGKEEQPAGASEGAPP